jgi:hypothetical protein
LAAFLRACSPAGRRFRSLARISVIPLPGTFLDDSKRADW